MVTNTVLHHRALSHEIKPNISEIYRYAGIFKSEQNKDDESIRNLTNESLNEISSSMNCRSVFIRVPILINFPNIFFANQSIKSINLCDNLKNCHSIYLFAATLGPEVDRIIQKNSKLNQTKAIFLQATAAMFIEEYCDLLQNFLLENEKNEGNSFKPRFSPGYGDVPLSVQNIFFNLLNCQKNIGLTLNNSLIMSPEKSVTAFIGIYKE